MELLIGVLILAAIIGLVAYLIWTTGCKILGLDNDD